ncbi:FixH family protein [Aquibacillus koreensis]|uniref:FixH family protein n=1 Tax=Aquibacillus koreensis TaxID=279446 RepID=A0A9X3WNX9_9BACI|nr:FixH family protein [Aquibacillus koreensis]MCT2537294.1 FixH family protein [Aquibacillus koreensis]MDC3421641.1 FixH family protein [Aquibacillus koreensis]
MKFFIPIMIIVGLLVGCGQEDTNNSEENEQLEAILEVDLQAPETLEVAEQTTIDAVVTQGGEVVDDADEVEFEIWMEGEKESSIMLSGNHQGEGVYRITTSFTDAGIYHVQSHVTARSMHTMPVVQITVGDVSTEVEEESEEPAETEESHEHHDDESEHSHDTAHDDDHHHGGVTMNLDSEDTFHAGEESALSVVVTNNEEALSDAKVSLEIKHTTESDDQWIDLDEGEAGTYNGTATLAHAGTYNVTIHVEKGEIHDHKEIHIDVVESPL